MELLTIVPRSGKHNTTGHYPEQRNGLLRILHKGIHLYIYIYIFFLIIKYMNIKRVDKHILNHNKIIAITSTTQLNK